MYEYIKGTIEDIGADFIIIENNNIGYRINTSKNTINDVSKTNTDKKIFTYLNVREDEMSLFGFTTKEELGMFKLLLGVSKIGPKVAIGILSFLNPSQLKVAIASEDTSTLSKAPGVGKKTASRIILEVKDKIKDHVLEGEVLLVNQIDNNSDDDALDALISLGYTRNEVISILNKLDIGDLSTEEIIKLTLKELAK